MADDGTKGFGQQDPADSVGDFNPIAFQIGQALAGISSTRIVKVLAVDTDKKTVDVQIATNQLDGQGNSTPHGPIYGLPYIWAMGGKNAFKSTPAKDDMGVIVVNDRDISAVKNTKAIANPASNRKFSPSDGIYLFGIPGLNGTAPVQWIDWTDDGINITSAHGNTLTSDASGWKFVGNVIMENNLQLAGAIQAVDGTEYAENITTTGAVFAINVVANPGPSQVTLLGHEHAANNSPPIPGH